MDVDVPEYDPEINTNDALIRFKEEAQKAKQTTNSKQQIQEQEQELHHLCTHPFQWAQKDVQSWFKATRFEKVAENFKEMNGTQLLTLSLDTNKLKLKSVVGSMVVRPVRKELMKIRSEFRIEEKDIVAAVTAAAVAQSESPPQPHQTRSNKRGAVRTVVAYPRAGVIPLVNQCNTCYLNSCLQALLQAPVLVPFLRQRKHELPYLQMNYNLLDALAALSQNAQRYETSFKPAKIRSLLSAIDNRFGSGEQDDSSLVMSKILMELDRLHNKSSGLEVSDNYRTNFQHQLNSDEEENVLHAILEHHNPNDSIIRRIMDGVQKTVTRCLECNYTRVKYETFRALQLPLIDNTLELNVAICFINQTQLTTTTAETVQPRGYDRKFQVLGYCSLITLKAQIAASITEEELNVSQVMDNILLFSVRPPKALLKTKSDHRAPAVPVHDWIVAHKDDEECSTLSASKVYAVVDLVAARTSPSRHDYDLIALFEVLLNGDDTSSEPVQVQFLAISAPAPAENNKVTCGSSHLIRQCRRYSRVNDHDRPLDVLLNNNLAPEAEFSDDSFDLSTSRRDVIACVFFWHPVTPPMPTHAKNDDAKYDDNNQNKVKQLDAVQDLRNDNIFQIAVAAVCGNRGDAANLTHVLQYMQNTLLGMNMVNKHTWRRGFNHSPSITRVKNTCAGLSKILGKLNDAKKMLAELLKTKRITGVSPQTRRKKIGDIRDSLAFLEKRFIFGDDQCRLKCNCVGMRSRAFSEQLQFVHTPTNLMLVIDRSGSPSPSAKLTHKVQYPVNETLVVGEQLQQQFQLFATCVHKANSMKFGHYIAKVRSLNTREWYLTSDSFVRRIHTSEVMDRNSIVLLYTKN